MKGLSNILEKVYNKIGNKYLVSKFETEPFEFKVNVRHGKDDDLHDYVVEVYSTPVFPNTLRYKPEFRTRVDGAHISVIENEFKNQIKYIDTSFGRLGRTYGVKFMNIDKNLKEQTYKIKSMMGVINESKIPIFIRRRLGHIDFQDEINNVIRHYLNPNDYSDSSEYVADVCNWVKDDALDGIDDTPPKDKDSLYNFLVHNFGDYIYSYYIMRKKRKR